MRKKIQILGTFVLLTFSAHAAASSFQYFLSPTYCVTQLAKVALHLSGIHSSTPFQDYLGYRLFQKVERGEDFSEEDKADAKRIGIEMQLEKARSKVGLRKELESLLVTMNTYRGATRASPRAVRMAIHQGMSGRPLTPEQKSLIESLKLADEVAYLAEQKERYPKLFWLLPIMRESKIAFSRGLLGAVLLGGATTFVGEEETDEEPEELQDDEIELIYLSPVPHTDLRIGKNVYSYSAAFVKGYTEGEYRNANKSHGFYGGSTRVKLKLSEAEVQRLKDYMESEVGKIYLFNGYSFSCVTATHRAIEKNTNLKVPVLVDRSPALAEAYFKALCLYGDPRVSSITFYYPKGANYYQSKGMDAGVSVVDSLSAYAMAADAFFASQLDALPNSFRFFSRKPVRANNTD